jgi:hypothetical protein
MIHKITYLLFFLLISLLLIFRSGSCGQALNLLNDLCLNKRLPHVIGIFPIRIVLGLHIVNLIAQRAMVQAERGPVADPDMQADILRIIDLCHFSVCLCLTCCLHQFGRDSQLPIRPQNTDRRDVAVHRHVRVLVLPE